MKVKDSIINMARDADFGPHVMAVCERTVHVFNVQDVTDTVDRRFGRNIGRIPIVEGMKNGVIISASIIRPVSMELAFPPECSRIHLCTPDPTGRSI